ncbi:unnamed protein product [Rhizophagus irregularis]|nr:unnamed protein product [Rhizophagus irregularis]
MMLQRVSEECANLLTKNVWYINPVFGLEFAESLNENTYVDNVVVFTIYIILFDNFFGKNAIVTVPL